MLTRNTRIATASASRRARVARPVPASDTSAPPKIGNQITRLNKGQVVCMVIVLWPDGSKTVRPEVSKGKLSSCPVRSCLDTSARMELVMTHMFLTHVFSQPDSCPHHPPQPTQQCDQAQDHGESISIQISRLHPAYGRGNTADTRGRTVDEDVIDHADITTLPQSAPQQDRAACEQHLIHLVDPVLAIKQAPQRMQYLLDAVGYGG